MTGILKDFNFAIVYLDDILIFSRTAGPILHLDQMKQVFEKLRSTHLSMKLSKCHFFTTEVQCLGHIVSTKGIRPLPSKTCIHQRCPNKYMNFMDSWHTIENSSGTLQKIAKPLTLLTHQQVKFEWTPAHHNAFLTLKGSVIQAPILHYPIQRNVI